MRRRCELWRIGWVVLTGFRLKRVVGGLACNSVAGEEGLMSAWLIVKRVAKALQSSIYR